MALSMSIVVGCMNRLVQAMEFVPRTLKQLQPGDELVLVDWDDPQHVTEWAITLQAPQLTIVRVAPCKWFEPNRQRNVGCRHAVGDLLVVSDIDFLMPDDLVAECRTCGSDEFLVHPAAAGSIGWLCVHWAQWRRVNGYEEGLSGYSYDDFYMRETFCQAGLKLRRAARGPVPLNVGVNSRSYPDSKTHVSHHVNMRLGKALRILHPFRGNYSRNWGSGGVCISESEARKNAPQARIELSSSWWSG